MRIFKWIKPLRFVMAVCVINVLLSFLIEPVRSSSGTMWEEYYKETELDMVFAGASFCAASFDPYIFDEELGVKSFNLGTPLQAAKQTVSALETVLNEHEVKTVIVGTGFFSLQEGPLEQAELTFEKAKAENKGGISGIIAGMQYMFSEGVRDTEKSIKFLFPWLYNQEEVSLEFIAKNVSAKTEKWRKKEEKTVSKKGYRPYLDILDYETMWEINSYTYYDQSFDEDAVTDFEKILKLCRDKGVEVIVVNTPHPAFDVISCYESYGENEKRVIDICESYGAEYYNFSLVKPELFVWKDEYFYDFEHLNEEGTKVFDKMLCEMLIRRADGENMEPYFYSVEEYFEVHESLLEEWKNEKIS